MPYIKSLKKKTLKVILLMIVMSYMTFNDL